MPAIGPAHTALESLGQFPEHRQRFGAQAMFLVQVIEVLLAAYEQVVDVRVFVHASSSTQVRCRLSTGPNS